MQGNDRPIGARYSHIYLKRGGPRELNNRARVRLGRWAAQYIDSSYLPYLTEYLGLELGVEIGTHRATSYKVALQEFFINTDPRDVLDAISLIWKWCYSRKQSTTKGCQEFVTRVFEEENIAYIIDENCGVHPRMDQEFIANVQATLAGLDHTSHAAVRREFEKARDLLVNVQPDTKGAVKAVFDSAEILTKNICKKNSAKRLGPKAINEYLKPIVRALYDGDDPARRSAEQFLDSFAKWTDAAQQYRHGQEGEAPADPPFELAVALFSTGATYIRFLIELSERQSEQNQK